MDIRPQPIDACQCEGNGRRQNRCGLFYNVSKEVLCLYVLIVIWRLTLSGELKSDIS